MHPQKTTKVIPLMANSDHYKSILDKHRLSYKTAGYYLFAGADPTTDGTLIYISVILSEIRRLLNILAPQLAAERLPFWVVRDKEAAKNILYGMLGNENLSKAIIVFVPANRDFNVIAQKLVGLTQGFQGPPIPDCTHLGGLVYITPPEQQDKPQSTAKSRKREAFQQKYIVFSTLKEDPKGDVLKGIYIKGFMRLGRCVIKEGRKLMLSDDVGRDMKDRMEWQHKVHQDLSGMIHIPEIIDLFEEKGNHYLVMEFIKGQILQEAINMIYKGKTWLQLPAIDKIRLLELLLTTIEMVETIHLQGYVHRDVTTTNFLLTAKNELYMIDFELTYGINLRYPLPVFGIGTPGFMSPEQEQEEKPTEKEDIYGLGAMMIVFFTNMRPGKIDQQHMEQVRNSIFFFTGNDALATITGRAVSKLANQRPELHEIKNIVTGMLAAQKNPTVTNSPVFEIPAIPSPAAVTTLLDSAFEGLTIPELSDNAKLFNVKAPYDFGIKARPNLGPGVGLMSPITGIFYVIDKAGAENCPSKIILFFRDYVRKHSDLILGNYEGLQPGLFYGSAGKALALHYGIRAGILPPNKQYEGIIRDCFSQLPESLDITHGIAGQAAAALLIYTTAPTTFLKETIDSCIKILLSQQKTDGSWQLLKDGEKKIELDIESGVSGIVLVLLQYDRIFPADPTKMSIERGLLWLKKNVPLKNSEKGITISGSATGCALVFLYAYEHLKNTWMKDTAEKILWQFIPYPVIEDYSLSIGLGIMGITYIKAAQICHNPEWSKRASWIYSVMEHTAHKKKTDKVSWNMTGLPDYDGDLVTGTAGIVLFLLEMQEMCNE